NKPEWSKFYENFKWYKPVTDKPEFSQEEQGYIEKLSKLEQENIK
ncbi:MAG: YARHG domain-containing protein, partial [Elusimicrobia bacterium]|nr:YARHG domain-containing protein [Elusimicrobiota bacterium]